MLEENKVYETKDGIRVEIVKEYKSAQGGRFLGLIHFSGYSVPSYWQINGIHKDQKNPSRNDVQLAKTT